MGEICVVWKDIGRSLLTSVHVGVWFNGIHFNMSGSYWVRHRAPRRSLLAWV